jgi:hypothetical protein
MVSFIIRMKYGSAVFEAAIKHYTMVREITKRDGGGWAE